MRIRVIHHAGISVGKRKILKRRSVARMRMVRSTYAQSASKIRGCNSPTTTCTGERKISDLFVDRLGNIVIADGVARLDFLRSIEIDAEKKQARVAPSVRLAIPLTGLVQAIEMLDKVRGQLVLQA